MTCPRKVVLLSGPEGDFPREEHMRFRLIYDGPLQSKQKDAMAGQRDPSAQHTHELRRVFHRQLKRHWETNRFLNETFVWRKDFGAIQRIPDGITRISADPSQRESLRDVVADNYRENGYRFIPLVREDWELLCDIDVLFLRRDIPGNVIHAGDIDNRIKTLLDGLRKPNNAMELTGNETPQDGEDPFYVLLEDDKLVTSLSVETDTLLDPEPDSGSDARRVRLVITVNIRPYNTTMFNLSFG